jgi:hypothetical protein
MIANTLSKHSHVKTLSQHVSISDAILFLGTLKQQAFRRRELLIVFRERMVFSFFRQHVNERKMVCLYGTQLHILGLFRGG